MSNLKQGRYFLPYNPQLTAKAKKLRKNPTAAEQKLWGFLRTFPVKMWRQKPIENFIVDFYCPKLKLVIEIDGDSHYSENAVKYDQERTEVLEGYGLKVIRFNNEDVLHNLAGVVSFIEGLIPPSPP